MKRCCSERAVSLKILIAIAKAFDGSNVKTLSILEDKTLSLLVNSGFGEIVESDLGDGKLESRYQFKM